MSSAEVVFVGGATVSLWITDPGAPPPRPTLDVDVVVEVSSRREYHEFEERLRAAGFRDEGTVICRWLHPGSDLVLDAMPTDAALLGFENRWQARAFPHGVERTLPSGARIRAMPPAYLLATKLEAHAGRGEGDLLGSRDFADIVALVDGREELAEEVRAAPSELRRYIHDSTTAFLQEERLLDGIRAQLPPDSASQVRADEVVLSRLKDLVDATGPQSR